ncbi:MAG: amidase [Pseudomonadales bacterium]|jgi:amidase|nr:amidase [Pseudomonadales bacterium]MDP7359409.1 amidase [Pseudomonadales bacterium]MDP7597558.1 amidase [Pseudomonadales bacterium]HJN51043.1 amidase [Pseudomonadales bacterium]
MVEMTESADSIDQARERMARGELSSEQLTRFYLDRIRTLNGKVNAVIEVNPDALTIAEGLDDERKAKGTRGPLHGIPVVLKDNIDTGDKMMTTAGSIALQGSHAARDSLVAARLRRAGAVILAKSNLSEWANYRGFRSSSGWSSRGGLTRNPYCLDRSAGGSSSGSAVAVAANMTIGAIGTETDGSIVNPCSHNSVVGIKPTVGLIGRSGIVPISHSQDTAGPMARTVRDVAILLGSLTGSDDMDAGSIPHSDRSHPDYTQFLDSDGLSGTRIGVARNFFAYNQRVDQIIERSLQLLKNSGAILVDPATVAVTRELRAAEGTVMSYEFKHGLNQYLDQLHPATAVRSLAQVIQFNDQNAEEVMPFFKQEILTQAEERGDLKSPEYLAALQQCRQLSRADGLDKVLHDYSLDAILAPSGGPAWVIDLLNGDRGSGGCSSAAAIAGYPHITVPAGYVYDLPVGISFFAGAFQEPVLLRIAYAFEELSNARRDPTFPLSLEL